VAIPDHVLGADPLSAPSGWDSQWPNGAASAYTNECVFQEPFVLFGFMAAVSTLSFITGVLVLPQRQTALVAKQAAHVDILSGGRLRLGVGIGWNRAEYSALGADFGKRGRKLEEQVAVLRHLWTEPVVHFLGEFHTLEGVGIRPFPLQRPIPIWMGGTATAALERIGRVADGWYSDPTVGVERAAACLPVIRSAAEQAGRDPTAIGFEARLHMKMRSAGELEVEANQWQQLSATHLTVDTKGCGRTSVDDHLEALSRIAHICS